MLFFQLRMKTSYHREVNLFQNLRDKNKSNNKINKLKIRNFKKGKYDFKKLKLNNNNKR